MLQGLVFDPFSIARWLTDPWTWPVLLAAPFIGSFLGLVSLRAPAGEPFIVARSRCAQCARRLAPAELLPLLSYGLQRGRCACRCSAIPWRYPALELASLVVAILSATLFTGPLLLASAIMGWTLLLAAVLDAEHFWLPDAITLPLTAGGLLVAALLQPETLAARAVGAALAFGLLWLVKLAYRRLRDLEGLGDGDPLLFAAAGAWTGWQALPQLLTLAAGLALLWVLGARLAGRRIGGRDAVPFGPFLAASLWLVWLGMAM